LIVVFRDASTLARLRMMCTTSPLIYRLFYRALRLPADCYMPGVCRRIYTETISGAGLLGMSPWPAGLVLQHIMIVCS
jgi:hypothetical protein